MKKDLLIIALKVIAYAIGLLLAYFGATALVSCSVSHSMDANGRCTIVTTDTTTISHRGFTSFPKR